MLAKRTVGRREFLAKTAAASLGLSAAAAALAACAGESRVPSDFNLARPDSPVTLPIYDDNPPIADGLEPERDATLRIYNWEEYLWARVAEDFAEKYSVRVEIVNFDNMDEALPRLRSGADFDVFFHRTDVIGRLAASKLLQPLNHSYVPNLSRNVWPVYLNPFYDQGARYGVPYTVYTTGIAWRVDRVNDDIAALSNPYEIFWDPTYQGKVHLLDDYREVISMALLKHGLTDLNTSDPDTLRMVSRDLATLAGNVGGLDIDAYSDLPQGESWIHQAYSGDVIAAQYYFPKGEDPSVMRYWFPPDGTGVVANDCIGVPRNARHPVLAHLFINYLLDNTVAARNFGWNGYQPPQIGLEPSLLVAEGYVAPLIKNTITRRQAFNSGFMPMELSPRTDSLWHNTWEAFKTDVEVA